MIEANSDVIRNDLAAKLCREIGAFDESALSMTAMGVFWATPEEDAALNFVVWTEGASDEDRLKLSVSLRSWADALEKPRA